MMKCLRDLQESRVVLVCQHLFNRQRKNNNKKYFMQMYTGTRLTTLIFRRLSPRFFTERRGASVHWLIFGCHLPLLQNYSYLANINMAFHCGKAQSGPWPDLKIKQRINLLIVGHLTKAITKTHYCCYYYCYILIWDILNLNVMLPIVVNLSIRMWFNSPCFWGLHLE